MDRRHDRCSRDHPGSGIPHHTPAYIDQQDRMDIKGDTLREIVREIIKL